MGNKWVWVPEARWVGLSDPDERRRAPTKEVEKQVDFERFRKL